MDPPAVYPAGIVLAFLSAATLLLDIPPFIWHVNHRNLAPATLIMWIILLNFTNVLNVILWPNDNYTPHTYHGEGVCDVEAKFFVGSWVALPCAFASILRNLARVMDPENIILSPTKAQKWRERAIDLLLTWACPIYLMAVHYVVQPNRYILTGISGCFPSFDESWLSSVLVFMWPCIFVLIDAYYAVMLIYRLRAYRRTMHLLLTTHNTNKSRFFRLTILALNSIVILTPLQFYVFYTNLAPEHHPYSWREIHDPATWNQVMFLPSDGVVLYDRWIRVGAGLLVFAFFGVGHDACLMYKKWLLCCGLGGLFPCLKNQSSTKRSANGVRSSFCGGGTWASVSSKAKDLFSSRRKSSSISLSKSGLSSKRTSIATTLRDRFSISINSPKAPSKAEKTLSYASTATQTDEVSLPSIIPSPLGKFSVDDDSRASGTSQTLESKVGSSEQGQEK